MQNPHSKSLRKGRVSEPGQIYLLTTTTIGRRPVFESFQAARLCICAKRFQQQAARINSLAFVLMPDHFHCYGPAKAPPALLFIKTPVFRW